MDRRFFAASACLAAFTADVSSAALPPLLRHASATPLRASARPSTGDQSSPQSEASDEETCEKVTGSDQPLGRFVAIGFMIS